MEGTFLSLVRIYNGFFKVLLVLIAFNQCFRNGCDNAMYVCIIVYVLGNLRVNSSALTGQVLLQVRCQIWMLNGCPVSPMAAR